MLSNTLLVLGILGRAIVVGVKISCAEWCRKFVGRICNTQKADERGGRLKEEVHAFREVGDRIGRRSLCLNMAESRTRAFLPFLEDIQPPIITNQTVHKLPIFARRSGIKVIQDVFKAPASIMFHRMLFFPMFSLSVFVKLWRQKKTNTFGLEDNFQIGGFTPIPTFA